MRNLAMIAAALLALSSGATRAEERGRASASRSTPTQLPRSVVPRHYSLAIEPDAAALSFRASVQIGIDVLEPTDTITLNAAALEMSTVSLVDRTGTAFPVVRTSVDEARQTASFVLSQRLPPGSYRLGIDYRGRIQTQAFGLFALDHEAPAGKQRALFTQFEPADARRVVPSWDEPSFRTAFDVQVTVPAGQTAVSNMPRQAVRQNADGTRTVTFATTPAMSTYLLFLGIGDFDRVTATAGDTELGVVTRAGAGATGRYAVDGAARLLSYYNDYFGIPYPLPKLDNVAGPGSGQFFNAMENWGAIFTFEDYLLVDPAVTSAERRQQIMSAMAHEMAHQWFGNLVTMAWWDDLWLNEGFASWMANKATNDLHPEWEPLLDRIRGREIAMDLDSLPGTHPVIQRITAVDQINQAFDTITYSKGEAVIVMLEGYVGAEAWRKGVRDYLAAHRLGNTVTDDLWGKIETAAGTPVTAIAHDFTLRPGVPLIRVEEAACRDGRTIARLRQGEFRRDRERRAGGAGSWHIPVVASVIGGGEARALVRDGSATLDIAGCGPLIVNSGQTGYYRTLYAPPLIDGLRERFATLGSMDQLGLLADNWSLGLAGYQPASTALALLDAIPTGAHPEVWEQAAKMLDAVSAMVRGDPVRQAAVARYASGKLSPELARIGWDARPGETDREPILRETLIGALGKLGDAAVVAEATRRFAAWACDPAALDGALRGTILGVVAANADGATWDRLRARAQAERGPLVRSQLYNLLASPRDEALARRALELALTDEPGAGTRSRMIEAVARLHPELAFDFAVRNRPAIQAMVDSFSLAGFIPTLASGSFEPAMVAKLADYAARHATPDTRKPIDIAAMTVGNNIRTKQAQLADIAGWIDASGVARPAQTATRPPPPWPHPEDVPNVEPLAVGPAGARDPDVVRGFMVRDFMSMVRLAAQYAISPDGKTVAYLSDVTGDPQLWTVGSGSGWPDQLTFGLGVDWIEASPDGRHILYGADTAGDERVSMNLISLDGKEEREVVPRSAAYRTFGAFSSDGKRIAYSSTERNGLDNDIFVADVETGRARSLYQGTLGFYVQAWQPGGSLLVVREQRGETGENIHLLDVETGKLTTILKPERAASYRNISWAPDGKGFYLSTNQDGDFSRVAYYDVARRELRTIAAADHDVGTVTVSGDGRYLAWTTIETGFNKLHMRDLLSGRDVPVPDLPAGTIQAQFAARAPVLALGVNSARTAAQIFVWDIAADRLALAAPAEDAGLDMSKMVVPTPVSFKARDGVTLTGLLYLPEKPLGGSKPPVYLSLHGGPSNHALAMYQADLQYYVARGIAVLDFNYRGSSGHGRRFAELNDRERKVDEAGDIADAVAWLRATGQVDGRRIAVGGASYGGYLTNLVLGTYPDMFVAGVSAVGVSNWVTALENASPFLKASDLREFGDIKDPKVRAFFARLSPINNAAKIKTPLMVLAGVNDVRDPVSESDELVNAVRAAGGEVTYLRFPDEGHDITKLANRIHANRRIAAFLEEQFNKPR